MVDRRRHAKLAPARPARRQARPSRSATVAYRSAARRTLADVYDADHVARGTGGRFRWLLSTCLAAAVGALAISVAIVGSLDTTETSSARLPSFQEMIEGAGEKAVAKRATDGLKWAAPKTDRLAGSVGAPLAKHVIHDQFQGKRDNRAYIQVRPYIRLSARLAAVPMTYADVIPAFNPLRLYAVTESAADGDGGDAAGSAGTAAMQVVELLGGSLPAEDGQDISAAEALELTQRALESDAEPAQMRPSLTPDGTGPDTLTPKEVASDRNARRGPEPLPANTTVLAKVGGERDDLDDPVEANDVRVVRLARGDTLVKVLQRMGADIFQARAMAEPAKSLLPDQQIGPGLELHVTMVSSLQRSDRLEPAAFSVFADGHQHKVTVIRNAAGEFVASASPVATRLAREALSDDDQPQSSSLYQAFYNAALAHGIPPDLIMQIMRIHAYETDFRRRVRASDQFELFFDTKEEPGAEPTPGELLYTSITIGGETQRYWRFRTPDGVVDYYDEFGNNSRKFLMRRPVRGDNVRFTSGFGTRRHPLLGDFRPHTGVDWAAPIGTPILAAGNGTIEEADRKGQYGNYVRIRHANGYQTAYAHMSRFGPGIREGVKVRQGQVIGFVGNTGFSTGPHLHYEVLVNNRYVDPMQIQVPRERRLTSKQAADFQRERQRLDEMMRRPPVMTVSR